MCFAPQYVAWHFCGFFVGAIKGDVKLLQELDPMEFERFSASSQAPFPDVHHARSVGAEKIIKELR